MITDEITRVYYFEMVELLPPNHRVEKEMVKGISNFVQLCSCCCDMITIQINDTQEFATINEF